MIEFTKELMSLKKGKFRPKGWKLIISELTGFGVSHITKILDGDRYNQKVALEIISHFNSEKNKLLLELKKAKISRK